MIAASVGLLAGSILASGVWYLAERLGPPAAPQAPVGPLPEHPAHVLAPLGSTYGEAEVLRVVVEWLEAVGMPTALEEVCRTGDVAPHLHDLSAQLGREIRLYGYWTPTLLVLPSDAAPKWDGPSQ